MACWDAENRLRAMQTTASAAAAGVPRQRLEFTYDHQSRRVRKVVKSFNPANQTFEVTKDTRFLYDGWNMIAELEASPSLPLSASPRLAATHAWGLDLSGTQTGAGGVGGLVFTALYSTTQTTARNSQAPPASVLAPCYDGNGNVLAYASADTGALLGRYEYDPFGKLLLREEDPRIAGRAAHLFSTKYFDAETGLSYYGFRYYSAELGRWVSRDPIGEKGGVNLYAIVSNCIVSKIDFAGLLDPTVVMAAEHAYELTCQSGDAPIRQNEFCGSVCKSKLSGAVQTTGPREGTPWGCEPPPCPDDGEWETTGTYHSHPGNTPTSYQDYLFTPVGQTSYVGTGSGVYFLGKKVGSSGAPFPVGCRCHDGGQISYHPPLQHPHGGPPIHVQPGN